MKKIISAILFVLFCFTACAKDTSSPVMSSEVETSEKEPLKMTIEITNDAGTVTKLIATLEDNSATQELIARLQKAPIKMEMQPYGGFEVYGTFDFKLPANDEHLTTKCGDLMLAWGNTLSLNYGKNTYSFTRIGFLDDVKNGKLDTAGLKKILGNGNCTAVLKAE